MEADVTVVSYQQELLDLYHEAYPDLTVCCYDRSHTAVSNSGLLWLGPGLFHQHLFLPKEKNDLQPDEGILIEGRKTYLLRRIDE